MNFPNYSFSQRLQMMLYLSAAGTLCLLIGATYPLGTPNFVTHMGNVFMILGALVIMFGGIGGQGRSELSDVKDMVFDYATWSRWRPFPKFRFLLLAAVIAALEAGFAYFAWSITTPVMWSLGFYVFATAITSVLLVIWVLWWIFLKIPYYLCTRYTRRR